MGDVGDGEEAIAKAADEEELIGGVGGGGDVFEGDELRGCLGQALAMVREGGRWTDVAVEDAGGIVGIVHGACVCEDVRSRRCRERSRELLEFEGGFSR